MRPQDRRSHADNTPVVLAAITFGFVWLTFILAVVALCWAAHLGDLGAVAGARATRRRPAAPLVILPHRGRGLGLCRSTLRR